MPTTTITAEMLLRATELDALDARILLMYVLGWSRAQLITRGDQALEASCVERFRQAEARRRAGEPVAQIVGTREFFGLPFKITPDVLIPRPETELLVELALEMIDGYPAPSVLDLGTGSGAIAISIAHERPDARIVALDRSPCALMVAQANAQSLLEAGRPGGAPRFLRSDWYAVLAPEQRFDIIVSNPPYIARHDPHLSQGDLRFEPRGALTDEADGLQAIRAIIAGARERLVPEGSLWIEHGYDQAAQVRELLFDAGFIAAVSHRDLADIERVTGGQID
jgi:release factor glutamine methyltransferase